MRGERFTALSWRFSPSLHLLGVANTVVEILSINSFHAGRTSGCNMFGRE